MKKLWKRAAMFFLAASLWAGNIASIVSVGEPAECSITVEMKYGGAAVEGGRMAVWQVGTLLEEDGQWRYEKTEDFSSFPDSLEGTEEEGLAEKLGAFAWENGVAAVREEKNVEGRIVFSGLAPGLYLIVQTEASAGYERVSPFLASVPTEEDGKLIYDVYAYGKFELTGLHPPETEPESKDTEPVGTLPQTGQLNWPVPVLAVAGMGFLLLGWALRTDGGDSHEE